jgi:hypothetical protein
MTGAQKRWLDAHREYEVMGSSHDIVVWTRTGTLTAEGEFEAGRSNPYRLRPDSSYPLPNEGRISVGVRTLRNPNAPKPIDMNQYPPAWGVGNSGVKVV